NIRSLIFSLLLLLLLLLLCNGASPRPLGTQFLISSFIKETVRKPDKNLYTCTRSPKTLVTITLGPISQQARFYSHTFLKRLVGVHDAAYASQMEVFVANRPARLPALLPIITFPKAGTL